MDICDSPAKGHSFCKIVLSEISFHDKLMIPRKYIRKYGKYLCARVYLKAPRGGVWPVDLVGYGCEDNLTTGQSTQVQERMMSDNDELKACKKTRDNSECIEAYHLGNCLMRILQHQKIAKVFSNKALDATSDDNIEPLAMPTKAEFNLHDPLHQDKLNKRGADSNERNSTTLASAKAYKSNIPSFVLSVAPSHLSVKGRVDIKKAFAVKYMRSTKKFKVCLNVKERSWPVMCTVCGNRYRFCKEPIVVAASSSIYNFLCPPTSTSPPSPSPPPLTFILYSHILSLDWLLTESYGVEIQRRDDEEEQEID
ncbi:hypothetical protein AgCh_034230 [Apium graveolens]